MDYRGLNLKSAKEKLQEIYGAKDFLRGNQEEFPDKYDYYQSQIDGLTQEENALSSWLGRNKGNYNGNNSMGDYYDDGDYYDSISGEDALHFNDDLFDRMPPVPFPKINLPYDNDFDKGFTMPDPWEGRDYDKGFSKTAPTDINERWSGINLPRESLRPPKIEKLPEIINGDSDDDLYIPIYDSEGNLINPIKDIHESGISNQIFRGNKVPRFELFSDSAPLSGRIDTDPDSGAGNVLRSRRFGKFNQRIPCYR